MDKIALIGCGKMGSALISGAVAQGSISADALLLCDAYAPAATALAERTGGSVSTRDEAAATADVFIICTKPSDVAAALAPIRESGRPCLILSVAAGVSLDTLTVAAGANARCIRSMPNTPALIGQGASAFTSGTSATPEDNAFARDLLGAVGLVREVPEHLMDAVTGLSGSGPAYVYLIIEAFADAGVKNGLTRADALALATQTVIGAAQMVADTGEHPAQLKDAVTSPGGTTIAGLAALEHGQLRSTLISAVDAATARSRELGQK